MTRLRGIVVGLSLVCLSPATPAGATQPGRCTTITEVDGSSPSTNANTLLSSSPARLCSVEFLATAALGYAQIYDAGATSETAANLAEPGADSRGGHAFIDFGDQGFVTEFGLGVFASNGRVRVRWGR